MIKSKSLKEKKLLRLLVCAFLFSSFCLFLVEPSSAALTRKETQVIKALGSFKETGMVSDDLGKTLLQNMDTLDKLKSKGILGKEMEESLDALRRRMVRDAQAKALEEFKNKFPKAKLGKDLKGFANTGSWAKMGRDYKKLGSDMDFTIVGNKKAVKGYRELFNKHMKEISGVSPEKLKITAFIRGDKGEEAYRTAGGRKFVDVYNVKSGNFDSISEKGTVLRGGHIDNAYQEVPIFTREHAVGNAIDQKNFFNKALKGSETLEEQVKHTAKYVERSNYSYRIVQGKGVVNPRVANEAILLKRGVPIDEALKERIKRLGTKEAALREYMRDARKVVNDNADKYRLYRRFSGEISKSRTGRRLLKYALGAGIPLGAVILSYKSGGLKAAGAALAEEVVEYASPGIGQVKLGWDVLSGTVRMAGESVISYANFTKEDATFKKMFPEIEDILKKKPEELRAYIKREWEEENEWNGWFWGKLTGKSNIPKRIYWSAILVRGEYARKQAEQRRLKRALSQISVPELEEEKPEEPGKKEAEKKEEEELTQEIPEIEGPTPESMGLGEIISSAESIIGHGVDLFDAFSEMLMETGDEMGAEVSAGAALKAQLTASASTIQPGDSVTIKVKTEGPDPVKEIRWNYTGSGGFTRPAGRLTRKVAFTSNKPGENVVSVSVRDAKGRVAKDSVRIKVAPSEEPSGESSGFFDLSTPENCVRSWFEAVKAGNWEAAQECWRSPQEIKKSSGHPEAIESLAAEAQDEAEYSYRVFRQLFTQYKVEWERATSSSISYDDFFGLEDVETRSVRFSFRVYDKKNKEKETLRRLVKEWHFKAGGMSSLAHDFILDRQLESSWKIVSWGEFHGI
ncbi:MAG: hypothetical protein ACE5LC_07915 [Candidatus Aminicenantales bacterium]